MTTILSERIVGLHSNASAKCAAWIISDPAPSASATTYIPLGLPQVQRLCLVRRLDILAPRQVRDMVLRIAR